MSNAEQLRRFSSILKDGGFPYQGRIFTEKIVCPDCSGHGVTWLGRPSNDAVSFTQSEWAEFGYEEQNDWMGGTYDRTCPECHGKNVVDVVDESITDSTIVNGWNEWMADYNEDEAVMAAERAMGC